MMNDKIAHGIKKNDQNISGEDINEIISKLKSFRFVHSIILFGSKARGTEKEKSDIDICIIPKPDVEITLKERISLSNSVPENIDISFIDELPVYIRKRIFLEGRVMYMDKDRIFEKMDELEDYLREPEEEQEYLPIVKIVSGNLLKME